MNKDTSLEYLNIMLIVIILMNIFTLSVKIKNIENFESVSSSPNINAELRQCSLYLTEDIGICNRLEEFYKMSDTQLQIYLDTIEGNVDDTTYNMIKHIKDTKKTIPLNACRINLNNWKEIHKQYGQDVAYAFKTINKLTKYNDNTLEGYCIKEDVNNSALKYALVNNKRYEIGKLDNTESIAKLIKKDVASTSTITLQNNVRFMKLHCYLENEKIIKIKKMDLVKYYDKKFVPLTTLECQEIINNLLKFSYKKKQIIFDFVSVEVACYKFVYDVTNSVESYTYPGTILFSLADLKLPNKIVDHNVAFSCTEDANISASINIKINKLIDDNSVLSSQIQTYDENLKKMMQNYEQMQKICADYATDNEAYTKCNKELEYKLSQYEILENERNFLQSQLDSKQYNYTSLSETNRKLRTTKFTFDEINTYLENGVSVSYEKYSPLLSNDDCIYFQI